MTSRTDPFPSTYVPARRFEWNRLAFTFALTLSAIVVFSAAFAVGYGRMNDGRVLPGVDVAGVDLAGLSRSAADAKLRSELPSLSAGSLTVNVGGAQDTIAYSEFSRGYDIDFMLNQAFGLGRGDNFVEQLREQMAILMNGVSVDPQVTWDNDELSARVAELAAAAQVAPVDATITRENGRYIVVPASAGTTVDFRQVVAQAMAAIDNLSPQSTQITIDGTPVLPSVSTEQAQAAADRAERVVASGLTASGAELSTSIDSEVLRGWVHLDQVALGEWQLGIEAAPIAQYLTAYATQTDIPATNATFGFTEGNVTVIPSAEGRALDVETTTANVLAALTARADGTPSQASLALVPTQPEFTTAQAQALATRVEMLGTWTTNYVPGPLNGNGVNIEIPTSKIDGIVLQPGEQLDYLTAIGEITSPPYVEGGVLIHGQIKEDGAIGGGMCSSSTTLFNAAMRAGLEVDARGNHSIYISRYPVGLDATVWESGGQRRTMAFTNDSAYPVLVKGINQRGKVTFEVWGVNDGRTVDLSDPDIQNIVKAGAWFEYSDDLPPGQKKFKQDGYDSFDASVTRTVRDAQGNVLHVDTWVSHYKKLDAITLVGRYPGDPIAGTRVDPSNYHPGGNPTPTPKPTPTPTPTGPGPTPTPVGPTAKFTFSQGDGTVINFFDTSNGDIVDWQWSFSDGGSASEPNPSHDFVTPGNYSATLTVTDSHGLSDTKTKPVTVAEPPPPSP
jgi:vancomycin resistance protein YoaR